MTPNCVSFALPSGFLQNQFLDWIFTRDEFKVTQVSVYQIVDGVDVTIVQYETGDIEKVDDFLPDAFDNYGMIDPCSK